MVAWLGCVKTIISKMSESLILFIIGFYELQWKITKGDDIDGNLMDWVEQDP